MPTPSPEISALLTLFAVAFTAPTFEKAWVLSYCTILAPGRRTVTAALRAMGLADEKRFEKYHRVLNRDRWSAWILSKILLELLIHVFVPAGCALLIVVDEHVERRWGPKIKYKGVLRDPIRSTVKRVSYTMGIRWIVLSLVVWTPWSGRQWSLPFMTFPALSPKTSQKLGKGHRTVVEWTCFLIDKVRRWQPDREIVLVGDGSYAAVILVQRCQRLKKPVKLVSRLRLDAVLHDPAGPQPKSKPGPKPKKGVRQPSLADRLQDPQTIWQTLTVPWYGGETKEIELVTGASLWYRRGLDPVPLRWVLVRCPNGSFRPTAFFCSDQSVSAEQIIIWFIARWNIEATFEEVRAHLGFETQRHWSDRAIERTTPCLMGLFSLVVVMAHTLHPEQLPIRQASWYPKQEATFSDALAAVRRDLWANFDYSTSADEANPHLISEATLLSLLDLACYSA
jgi:hypothetical protein